jgi:micrococcal nuclease
MRIACVYLRAPLLALAVMLIEAPFVPAAARADRLPGPVPATVERIVDGDTLAVRARIWIGQEVRVLVRIRHVDAAESPGRCEAEAALARAARIWLERELGGDVQLRDIGGDKFGGRVIAEVWSADGRDLGRELLEAGLARPYTGRGRESWCPPAPH